VSFFRPHDATLDAYNATSVLNQNNHTTFHKFTRYVIVTPRLLLLYKVAYGNSIPEETNASLEEFGSSLFPEPRSHRRFCIRINFVVNLSSFVA